MAHIIINLVFHKYINRKSHQRNMGCDNCQLWKYRTWYYKIKEEKRVNFFWEFSFISNTPKKFVQDFSCGMRTAGGVLLQEKFWNSTNEWKKNQENISWWICFTIFPPCFQLNKQSLKGNQVIHWPVILANTWTVNYNM